MVATNLNSTLRGAAMRILIEDDFHTCLELLNILFKQLAERGVGAAAAAVNVVRQAKNTISDTLITHRESMATTENEKRQEDLYQRCES